MASSPITGVLPANVNPGTTADAGTSGNQNLIPGTKSANNGAGPAITSAPIAATPPATSAGTTTTTTTTSTTTPPANPPTIASALSQLAVALASGSNANAATTTTGTTVPQGPASLSSTTAKKK